MKLLLLLPLLASCAHDPYWVRVGPALKALPPVYHATRESFDRACAIRAHLSCETYSYELRTLETVAQIHYAPGFDACAKRHAQAHVAWSDGYRYDHDQRVTIHADCGPE